MNEKENLSESTEDRIRTVIKEFIQAQVKKKQKQLDNHQAESWIATVANKAHHIQQATHVLKYTHPDARGTSLNVPGNPAAGDLTVGTHTIAGDYQPDFDRTASFASFCGFLSLEIEGQTLLKRAMEGDPALKAALTDDPELSEKWMASFAAVASGKDELKSHTLAKQVYWPLDDGSYHLLSPLFPTSLVHAVCEALDPDRFSEESKASRIARDEGVPHERGYRKYPNLAVQHFGGGNSQNISQLNIERHGQILLLPSGPPEWISQKVKEPLKVKSVFGPLLENRTKMRNLTRILREFLLSVQDVNNIRIRNKRAELVAYIRDELLQFAAEIQDLPAGWSAKAECRLNPSEQCWLDPGRAVEDEAFAALRQKEDWKNEICRRFGNWLNARLTDKKLPMGEDEAREWSVFLNEELRMLRMEVDINE